MSCLLVCHRGRDTVCSTFVYSTQNNTVYSVSWLLFIITVVLELYVALTQSCVVYMDHYLIVCCDCTVIVAHWSCQDYGNLAFNF